MLSKGNHTLEGVVVQVSISGPYDHPRSSTFNSVVDLLTRIEFVVGGFFGGLALAAYIVSGYKKQKPGWGLALTSASLLGIFLTSGPH